MSLTKMICGVEAPRPETRARYFAPGRSDAPRSAGASQASRLSAGPLRNAYLRLFTHAYWGGQNKSLLRPSRENPIRVAEWRGRRWKARGIRFSRFNRFVRFLERFRKVRFSWGKCKKIRFSRFLSVYMAAAKSERWAGGCGRFADVLSVADKLP